ncbi:hypothetical protein BDV26DRAFT_91870 [Aspergillus bertholletiae]|uniref:Uncharacterized protein n=1 Tax=Aspergillus bertholletiae TaxID=1226010 RepID=A0A5N7BPB8_9EURO|nr:hypothetical protein BDV26DRAFT_91870 [Aspergillus bertholletiae]
MGTTPTFVTVTACHGRNVTGLIAVLCNMILGSALLDHRHRTRAKQWKKGGKRHSRRARFVLTRNYDKFSGQGPVDNPSQNDRLIVHISIQDQVTLDEIASPSLQRLHSTPSAERGLGQSDALCSEDLHVVSSAVIPSNRARSYPQLRQANLSRRGSVQSRARCPTALQLTHFTSTRS